MLKEYVGCIVDTEKDVAAQLWPCLYYWIQPRRAALYDHHTGMAGMPGPEPQELPVGMYTGPFAPMTPFWTLYSKPPLQTVFIAAFGDVWEIRCI
jgi:hypothetical protein